MACLHYFDGRGKGEMIRLLLCVAKVEFTESYIRTREDFLKLVNSGKLLFRQVPLLEVDGLTIVQTNAILNYVAEKHGLYGSSAAEKCRVDVLFEGSRDFVSAFMPIGFTEEKVVLQKCQETTLPKLLPIFESELAKSTSGFLVGDKLSKADCGLLEGLLSCLDYFGEDVFMDYPKLKGFVALMKTQDGIAHYLKTVRKRPNDEEYIKQVQTSLGQR